MTGEVFCPGLQKLSIDFACGAFLHFLMVDQDFFGTGIFPGFPVPGPVPVDFEIPVPDFFISPVSNCFLTLWAPIKTKFLVGNYFGKNLIFITTQDGIRKNAFPICVCMILDGALIKKNPQRNIF